MKKILITIILVSLVLTLGVSIASANYTTEANTQLSAAAGAKGAEFGKARDPRLVAAYTLQILLGTLGIVFVAYIKYAGFLIMTSAGEEEKISKGKRIIRLAIIGTVITLSAFSVTLFLNRYLIKAIQSPPTGAFYGSVEWGMDSNTDHFYNDDPLSQSTNLGGAWGSGSAGGEWTP